MIGQLDRLDEVVGERPAGRDEPLAEPVDALVVVRAHQCRSAPTARAANEPGSSRDLVLGEAAGSLEVAV